MNWAERNAIDATEERQAAQSSPKRLRFSGLVDKTEGMTFSREPRYACHLCRDTGWVRIAHPQMVAAIVADPDTSFERYSVVICSGCDVQANHSGQWTSGRRKGQEISWFGSQPWHFNTHDPQWRLDAAAYVHKPENYNAEFEAFG